MRQYARLLLLVALALAGGLSTPAPSSAADRPPATFTIALMQVSFTDVPDSSHAYDLATLQAAGNEIASFYSSISYGSIAIRTKVARVTLAHDRAYYYAHCENDTAVPVLDRCEQYLRDVVTAMRARESSFFDGVDAVDITTPGNLGNGEFSWNPIDPGLGRNVQRAYLKEGALIASSPAPWPSRVPWYGWAHEIGHELQYAANIDMACGGTSWCGHPSGYSSGYDLMDSCYPCDETSYGLVGPPIIANAKGVFRGWLDPSRVVTVASPAPGATAGGTYVLPPLTQNTGAPVTQAIYIPISSGQYYLVNTRTRNGADALSPPGIWDEGVQISYVVESNSIPLTPCAPVPGTHACVKDLPAPPGVTCRGRGDVSTYTGAADQCGWPYALWHTGQTFSDDANNLRIEVQAAVGGSAADASTRGWTVTVARGVPPGRPDLYLIPWLTPPYNQYETVDIWVDSSCNGYEADGGLLRYGRNSDPEHTVSRSGDDPCVNHENRIYARIHNGGTAASTATTAHVHVTDPLGMGVTGHWADVGSVAVPPILPGATATVYVNWTPSLTLTPAQVAAAHFAFHSCIQVRVDSPPGEVITANNEAQENIDVFEARTDPPGGAGAESAADPGGAMMASGYEPMEQQMFVRNPFAQSCLTNCPAADLDPHRMFQLIAQSKLPPGWRYVIGDGQNNIFLGPDELRRLPVKIIPAEAAVAHIYELKASASTYRWMYNTALPASAPHHRHMGVGEVGGVTLAAHTVYRTRLTLARADAQVSEIKVRGQLRAKHPNTVIAIDYADPRGHVTTRLVRTDESSDYHDSFTPRADGAWHVRAMWQGDMDHASAVADLITVPVQTQKSPKQTPAPATPPAQVKRFRATVDCSTGTPRILVTAALSNANVAALFAEYRQTGQTEAARVPLTMGQNEEFSAVIAASPVEDVKAKQMRSATYLVGIAGTDKSGGKIVGPVSSVLVQPCR